MLDANVLIAGMVWPRWSFEILQHALKGDFCLVLSEYVINQARRHLDGRFPAYLEQFEEFLQASGYEKIKDPQKEDLLLNASLVRDITDVPVALAAIQAKVDCLISADKDLTAKDDTTKELRMPLRVLIPGTFLHEMMGWNSDRLEEIRNRTWRNLAGNEEQAQG
jgi:predicted nucleic acid-binding protein